MKGFDTQCDGNQPYVARLYQLLHHFHGVFDGDPGVYSVDVEQIYVGAQFAATVDACLDEILSRVVDVGERAVKPSLNQGVIRVLFI